MERNEKTFTNMFPNFYISGKYTMKKGEIIFTELSMNCSEQIATTRLDFTPRWEIKGNILTLELKPVELSKLNNK